MRGSCANYCHYGGEGKRCALRPGKLIKFPSTFLTYVLGSEFFWGGGGSAKHLQITNSIHKVIIATNFDKQPLKLLLKVLAMPPTLLLALASL